MILGVLYIDVEVGEFQSSKSATGSLVVGRIGEICSMTISCRLTNCEVFRVRALGLNGGIFIEFATGCLYFHNIPITNVKLARSETHIEPTSRLYLSSHWLSLCRRRQRYRKGTIEN